MIAPSQHPQPFNRISFITLNSNRLFTASQVADLIQKHSTASNADKILDELDKWRKQLKREHLGIWDENLADKIKQLRQQHQEQP